MEITLNETQRLFVFSGTGYVSCMGFDVVHRQCLELASRIHKFGFLTPGVELAPIREDQIGTLTQYRQYQDLLAIIGNREIGTWFDFTTPAKVRNVLERYRKNGDRLRLFYGDTKTGRSWMDEYDMIGRIGRSTGVMQIPLLIEGGECGGPGVLDACIVRILDADTRSELYRHEHFHVPEMDIRLVNQTLDGEFYSHGVWVQGKDGQFTNHANFPTFGKAAQWVAFMTGDCTEQPG